MQVLYPNNIFSLLDNIHSPQGPGVFFMTEMLKLTKCGRDIAMKEEKRR